MKRTGNALLAVVLGLGGLVALAGPATAAACSTEPLYRGDLDGDTHSDVVVGMPWYGDASGAVDVRYTGHASRLITAGQLGGEGEEATSFGSAVAMGDLDGDGCADLVIGANREHGDQGYAGAVHIVFGSPTGLVDGSFLTLPYTGTGNNTFDDFGISLALAARAGTTNGTHDLYVGAPGRTVSGKTNAGGVVHYTITPTGNTSRVTVSAGDLRTQDSPGVPGAAEKDDRFGEVLSADSYRSGVFASAWKEDVGSAVNAGAVWWLGTKDDGTLGSSYTYSQDSAGVPGKAETGDHFGAALSNRGAYVIVGVPGENDGKTKDSGLAQLFKQATTAKLTPLSALTQDSPGIPGAVEDGDGFGAAVVAGSALYCGESVDFAIGAPGEDVGNKQDAGNVTLFALGNTCQATSVRQGSGLGGGAEAGDEVGGILTGSRGTTDTDAGPGDRLLLGVPLEDIGAVGNAGMVQSTTTSILLNGSPVTNLQFSRGFINSQNYGMVVASTSD